MLLSVASIGCLLLGSPAAARQGKQIFEALNKAILASVGESPQEMIAGIDIASVGKCDREEKQRALGHAPSKYTRADICSIVRSARLLSIAYSPTVF